MYYHTVNKIPKVSLAIFGVGLAGVARVCGIARDALVRGTAHVCQLQVTSVTSRVTVYQVSPGRAAAALAAIVGMGVDQGAKCSSFKRDVH